ncbi:MAG TPA: AAA family ATPase [Saprospiraceae bacterium]|nr:AAA family ATPase [Saprospiraceae bacterium]
MSDTNIKTSEAPVIHGRMNQLLGALCKGLYEKEKSVRLALLSALAGESIFLLGPPGVGKSLIARRLKYAFQDGTSFEYLMSKFSTPDEIFGPVSIKKLKEEDKYERLTDRYLPGANIVFLDEIWKAGPAIQNALLTILNEKIYRNGDRDIPVNIRGIITASNELPPNNTNLAPIWDRFLIRLEVGGIRQFDNFLNMITDTRDVYEDNLPEGVKLKDKELKEWDRAIDQIEVPAEVLNTIQVVKIKIQDYNDKPNNVGKEMHIFDRRWKKIIRLLRTSAFLNGRQKVDLMDCFLMIDCLWSQPSQKEVIEDIVRDAIRKHGYTMAVNLQMIKREVNDFEGDVNQEIKVPHTVTREQLEIVQDEYYRLVKEDNKFEGVLVPTKQFRKLENDNQEVTNFYDEALNLRNRLKASRGTGQFTIDVEFNSEVQTYRLATLKGEKTEIIFKKPHDVVAKYWEERFQRVHQYIDKQLDHIGANAPEELQGLENNLFVHREYAEIVSANLNEVRTALQNLKLRLEKIRFSYNDF